MILIPIIKCDKKCYNDFLPYRRNKLTCDDDNIGSSKIIESNGGKLENKVENKDCDEVFLTRRYWIKK